MELFELETRPFKLRVAHKGPGVRMGGPRYFRSFALPDSMYRAAARKVVTGLLRANAKQRARIATLETKLAMLRPRDRRWP